MPGLDRQGPPFGDGNQSGRKMGKCNPENKNMDDLETARGFRQAGKNRSETNNPDEDTRDSWVGRGMGRGMGRKRGRGLGMRRGDGKGLGKRMGDTQNNSKE